MRIDLPNDVTFIIDKLYKNGFLAYTVGGCVRDSIMGNKPKDWDICTNAKPNEVKKVFDNIKIIDTGIKHGTITIRLNKNNYEVTTFRSEIGYSDSRHPDEVVFETTLEKDLSRRDFTMNAIAYNQYDGIVDPFNGEYDIKDEIINTVGNSDNRFSEDALRIMRTLRFSSVLGFKIGNETSKSIHKNKLLLNNISVERIYQEFIKLLCGDNAVNVLREYADVLSVFIPDILNMIGFNQHSPYHKYDVWEHTLHALKFASKDLKIRLAILFHDIGKPASFTLDSEGTGHFYNHPQKSAEITESILKKLKADNNTIKDVIQLVEQHNRTISIRKKSIIKAFECMESEYMFKSLMEIKKCDIMGQSDILCIERLEEINQILDIYEKIKNDNNFVINIKSLEISGRDIILLGIPQSKQIGEILKTLLNKVIDGEIENNHNELVKTAMEIIHNESTNII